MLGTVKTCWKHDDNEKTKVGMCECERKTHEKFSWSIFVNIWPPVTFLSEDAMLAFAESPGMP